jgi:hypothetical protein
MKRARFAEILKSLTAHDVEFVVVGMTADNGRGYEDLLPGIIQMKLSDGSVIRVLSLSGLIEAKERAGRPKDLAALPVLRATLDETTRRR